MRSGERGFNLVTQNFGYGPNGRYGIDLVFEELDSAGNSLFHIVEAKGFASTSVGGKFALEAGLGNEGWTDWRIDRALKLENLNVLTLQNNAHNIYYISFTDKLYEWIY